MAQEIVSSSGDALELKEWERPTRVVREFNIKVGGKNIECVTTRGERYTYLTIDGVDLYTDGLLEEGKAYKVREMKEEVEEEEVVETAPASKAAKKKK